MLYQLSHFRVRLKDTNGFGGPPRLVGKARSFRKPVRDTTAAGDLVELEVTLALMRNGRRILKPLSAGSRYDLLIDDGDRFIRVQCKSGVMRAGRILFRVYSVNASRRAPRTYQGEVDAFGVHCRDTGQCYLVPMEAVAAHRAMVALRVSPTLNRQARGVRHAQDFVIGPRTPAAVSFRE
ncbi:MAG: group I intron-associated PD-(D/E)XK endonuclease [Chloroflexota bacterium]|nr:group I intron-associated PD-(D/E)XK endonuclease [Chloroflexota bacterium]